MKKYSQEDLIQVISYIHGLYAQNNQATRAVNHEILALKTGPEKVWTNKDIIELLECQVDMFEIFHVFATTVETKFMEMVPSLVHSEIAAAILKSNSTPINPQSISAITK